MTIETSLLCVPQSQPACIRCDDHFWSHHWLRQHVHEQMGQPDTVRVSQGNFRNLNKYRCKPTSALRTHPKSKCWLAPHMKTVYTETVRIMDKSPSCTLPALRASEAQFQRACTPESPTHLDKAAQLRTRNNQGLLGSLGPGGTRQ